MRKLSFTVVFQVDTKILLKNHNRSFRLCKYLFVKGGDKGACLAPRVEVHLLMEGLRLNMVEAQTPFCASTQAPRQALFKTLLRMYKLPLLYIYTLLHYLGSTKEILVSKISSVPI